MKERDFIHNLASPVSGMEFILESALDDLTAAGVTGEAAEKLREVLLGIRKVRGMLKERREEIGHE